MFRNKIKYPKFAATTHSLLNWAGFLFVAALGAAIVQAVLNVVIVVLGLLALMCLLAAGVLAISNQFKTK